MGDPPLQAFERVARRKLRQLDIASRLEDLRIPPAIDWKHYEATELENTASGSTTNSAFALFGQIPALKPLRSLITTDDCHRSPKPHYPR